MATDPGRWSSFPIHGSLPASPTERAFEQRPPHPNTPDHGYQRRIHRLAQQKLRLDACSAAADLAHDRDRT
jgi:hypothetical protein